MTSVQAFATPNRIAIGDTLTYVVTITHDPLDHIKFTTQNFSPYECLATSVNVQGNTTILTYTLQGFNPHEPYIPTQTLTLETSKSDAKQLLVPPYFIEIKSAFTPTEDRLLQPSYQADFWVSTWLLILTALVFLLVYIGYRWLKKRQNAPLPITDPMPTETPLAMALRQLQELQAHKFIEKGLLKEHYIGLTEILKHYFETRYEVSLLDQTTEETLRLLGRFLQDQQCRRIQHVLMESDLIKFAKWVPSLQEHEALLEKVKDILHKDAGL